ncbi:hypothetical protein LO763_07725 [Glycomyces sp. A-F 0318]|uniref:hypothetical protein n=1 Tax=Glycomyces amatae TaxID=2881355 RepID=UPI001E641D0C|nr:hypothetical protein [Glycomyces amatae]MCD0443515.1 hypothetical protein [Glycomyces amatae]
MHGTGGDQGGHWPAGVWFALVGVSAGTVTSFALIGWTFTRSLYGGVEAAEPLEFESGTVVIEAEEDPAEESGEDPGAEGTGEPGGPAEVDSSPAEPQAEPRGDAEPEPAEEAPEEPAAPVEQGEAEDGGGDPELVPVEEDGSWCPPDAEAGVPDWDYEWRPDGEDPRLRPEFDAIELPEWD